MHTHTSLLEQLQQMRINQQSVVLVHSSMKSLGEVEGGANTVLDVLEEYMKDGLLVLPTHTWANINENNPKFYVEQSPSCIGILPELFRKRHGVIRSWHPTHSVAAKGQDADWFTKGDEAFDTPCARGSAWGKLLDHQATILLIGVDLRRNTFMHGVEEWLDIPGRMTEHHEKLQTILGDGTIIEVPSRRHCGQAWSEYFWKVEDVMVKHGALVFGELGDAVVRICDTVKMTDILTEMLREDPDLFSDNEPLSQHMKQLFDN
ncbi:AAC(3) family N-acetyltransferase [Paenibacillus crassostreae]|uniref:Aminoglycoside N(3)-acetyltransferase n=1 Tax=Paenibacillus crassostreae TaxID=1763538 RepID=A0A167FSA4_9BACL|nr:AAC(3) family N-acetyltransferase [Paenibacillus crassostreae]AOZ94113.1 AAC(3) family N-acetyltransferase [Paenibacillus crassostreae]OAB76851.1 aminoglycoside 3-N-acetyltransferase [Paenibacillus crassostreae]